MRLGEFAVRNRATVFFALFAIIVAGSSAYTTLPRESFPDIEIPNILVYTLWPGASPTDVESQLTDELERELQGLEGIKQITSTSTESVSVVNVEFVSGVDLDFALQKVRDRVNLAKSEFPADAEEPILRELNFSDVPILQVHLSGDVGPVELRRLAKAVQDEVEAIPGVLRATLVGGVEREVQVAVDPERLRLYGASLDDVLDAIRDENVSIPGGELTLKGQTLALRVLIGSRGFLEQNKVDPAHWEERAEAWRADAKTVVFFAIDGVAAGIAGVADPIKDSTAEAIAGLKNSGIRVVMLTGDSRSTADAVARQLGIDETLAEVLPEDKAGHVKRLQAEGRKVAMAGDGINDAPALAQADVGIAMGTGTDVAMESAGVTLVKGDLRGIARAVILSRATMRNIRQNLTFAFGYNALGIPVAAGVLYPAFGLLLSPMFAGAAMALSSVSVVTNALRLNRIKL